MSEGVRKLFGEVPQTYELVNHVLTLGMDILWRRRAARIASSGGGVRWLDMCSGTGETAVYLRRFSERTTTVVSCDFSLPMILRAAAKTQAAGIAFTLADARRLPFPDGTFDLVTMSFATRNVNTSRAALIECLREYARVLKPGGRFVNLETSQPASGLIRRLFHLYVGVTVRPLGTLLSGSKAGYAYLAHTIPRFYDAIEFASILGAAGFKPIRIRPMLFGVAAVHEART